MNCEKSLGVDGLDLPENVGFSRSGLVSQLSNGEIFCLAKEQSSTIFTGLPMDLVWFSIAHFRGV